MEMAPRHTTTPPLTVRSAHVAVAGGTNPRKWVKTLDRVRLYVGSSATLICGYIYVALAVGTAAIYFSLLLLAVHDIYWPFPCIDCLTDQKDHRSELWHRFAPLSAKHSLRGVTADMPSAGSNC
jgi:hypothetical protein